MTSNTSTRQGLANVTAHMEPLIRAVKSVANRSRKAGHAINPTTDAAYNDIDAFFECLDQVDMTPDLKEHANIHEVLRLFFAREECFFPGHYRTRANTLFDKFEAMHWGGVPNDDTDAVLVPPRDHAIWGVGAIMDGLAYHKNENGRLYHGLAAPGAARNADLYGDNGLVVGQWYPSQLAAFVGGAHGHINRGIYWPNANGPAFIVGPAYSVVIAGGRYSGLNDDKWDVVLYAGTRSHANTDAEKVIEENGTKALEASITSSYPVRVFRSSHADNWKPRYGFRYDGLYDVTASVTRENERHGLYTAFELHRRPGQLSREECLEIPNVDQQEQYGQIDRLGYQYHGRFYPNDTWKK